MVWEVQRASPHVEPNWQRESLYEVRSEEIDPEVVRSKSCWWSSLIATHHLVSSQETLLFIMLLIRKHFFWVS